MVSCVYLIVLQMSITELRALRGCCADAKNKAVLNKGISKIEQKNRDKEQKTAPARSASCPPALMAQQQQPQQPMSPWRLDTEEQFGPLFDAESSADE